MYQYQINNFLVKSDIQLPCDPANPHRIGYQITSTVLVKYRVLPFEFVHAYPVATNGSLRSYEVGDGILLCAGNNLRLHIDLCGTTITIDRNDDVLVESAISAVCFGLSVCSLLKGELVLHAACAEIDGKVIGISAASGTGKSTLLWSLLQAGARFASDDTIAIDFEEEDIYAIPSISMRPKLRQSVKDYFQSGARSNETWPGSREYWMDFPQ